MNRTLVALLALLSLVVTACGATPASPAPSADPAAQPSAPTADRPLPVVVTTDMGMDDLLALYILLRDPAVDVRAMTVDGTGLIRCGAGVRNLRRILAAFDRTDVPFACGREDPGPDGIPFPAEWRDTADAMYGVVLPPVVASDFPPDAVTVLRDAITAEADPVTIVALGPWTTLEDLFAASPELAAPGEVAAIHAMAGAVDVPGNMTVDGMTSADGVEWNVGADPSSMAAVLALDIPVTIVPLDATDDVPVPADILARLDADHASAGADIAYETYARTPYLATEGNFWWDSTAAEALTQPDLLAWNDARLAISEHGRLTRDDAAGRPVRFAVSSTTDRVQAAVLEGLRRGAPRPVPFATPAVVRVTWDGTACRLDTPSTAPNAGLVRLELVNSSTAPVGLLGAGVVAPKGWTDAVAWIGTADFADESAQPPDWIVQLEGQGPFAEAAATSVALVPLPAGEVGLLCATGEWPKLDFTDAGSIQVAP